MLKENLKYKTLISNMNIKIPLGRSDKTHLGGIFVSFESKFMIFGFNFVLGSFLASYL